MNSNLHCFVIAIPLALSACNSTSIAPGSGAELARAKSEIQGGHMPEALVLLDEFIAANPDDVDAVRERAFVQVELRNLPEARDDLLLAIQLEPGFAWSHYKLGFVLFLLGESDEALVRHTRAIELDPKFMMAYQNRAWIRQERGEFEGAIADYTQALKLLSTKDPLYRACLWSRSECYFQLDRTQEGQRDQDAYYASAGG